MSKTRMINIRTLKEFALEKLPKNHPLRDVLLTEKDEMPAEEFLIKMDVCLSYSKTVIDVVRFNSNIRKDNLNWHTTLLYH